MKNIEITAVKRDLFGKKESKRLTKEGMIPCTISGNGATVHFALSEKTVKPLIYTSHSYIVNLDIEGKKEIAVMREVQFHPVREQILHMDFYRALPGKEVAIDIPIKLEGNPKGVRMGGKLTLSKRKLHVKGILETLPDDLLINIDKLEIGKSIFVGDLDYKGLTILTPKTTSVCSVNITRAARSATSTAEAEEEEKEAEGEAEGGEVATEAAAEE